MGERVEGFGPIEGDKAQNAPRFEQDMGLGLLHGGRLTGDSRVARRGLAGLTANWQDIPMSAYPATRMRRLRRHDWTRRLVAENTLAVSDLIWPIFVIDGDNKREAVASMPGVDRLTVDLAVKAAKEAASLGIPVIALFPSTDPRLKSEDGREAVNADNLICRSVRAIKQAAPEIGILCDVALDPYTSHGHDGLIRDGDVHNDSTIEVLVRQALVQTEAGADIIAPSDMMDGRVGAIRNALEKHGHHNTLIMAY